LNSKITFYILLWKLWRRVSTNCLSFSWASV